MPPAPYRRIPGPSGPESRKSLRKSLPGPSGPGVQKVSETVSEESPKKTVLRLRRLFRDCFGHLLDPGAGRPRETLSQTLWGFRARRARETPLRGGRHPKVSQILSLVQGSHRGGEFCMSHHLAGISALEGAELAKQVREYYWGQNDYMPKKLF